MIHKWLKKIRLLRAKLFPKHSKNTTVSATKQLAQQTEQLGKEIEKKIDIHQKNIKHMITSRWYTEQDFQNANPSCSLQDMRQSSVDKLDAMCDITGQKERITCAYRSHRHDTSRGRPGTSAHIPRDADGNVVTDENQRGAGSMAFDIATPDSRARMRVMKGAIGAGFNRIGVNLASNFYHLDDSEYHDQEVLFTY